MLVNDLSTLREFFALPASFQFKAIKPSIRAVEREYLLPVLGTNTLAQLTTFYSAPAAGNQQLLVELFNEAVVNLSLFEHQPKGNVVVDESGTRIVKEGTMVSAWPWQVKELRDQLFKDGYRAIETMLQLLENNPSDFAAWHTQMFAANKKLLLHSATLFSQFFNIRNSRNVFIELIPIITRLEADVIIPIIGIELYQDLKTSPTKPNYPEILKNCRYILAQKSIQEGIVQNTLTWSRFGIVYFEGNSSADSASIEKVAQDNRLDYIARRAGAVADAKSHSLKSLVNDLAAKGELDIYKNSAAYAPDYTEEAQQPDNGYIGI